MKEKHHTKIEKESRSQGSQTLPENHQELQESNETDSPSQPPKQAEICWHLDLRMLTSNLWENVFPMSVAPYPRLVVLRYLSPSKLLQSLIRSLLSDSSSMAGFLPVVLLSVSQPWEGHPVTCFPPLECWIFLPQRLASILQTG